MSVLDSALEDAELEGIGDESNVDFAADSRGCEDILIEILIAIIAGCAGG